MKRFACILVSAVSLLGGSTLFAATRTWTGGNPSDGSCQPFAGKSSWAIPCNWAGKVAPAAGDDLVFPSGVFQLNPTNTFTAGTLFNSITISGSGYVIGENAITLNAGLTNSSTAGGSQVSFTAITLNTNLDFTVTTADITTVITSAINNDGHRLRFAGAGNFVVTGAISGSGAFSKIGGGIVQLLGPNSYTGTTGLNAGTLLVFGSQPASDVDMEGGTLGGGGTVGPVAVRISGTTVAPGALNNGTAVLTVNGDLTFASSAAGGTKSLVIDLKGTASGTQYDRVRVNGLVNVTQGNTLTIVVGGGFTPAPGDSFIIIDNDGVDAVQGSFDGLPEGTFFTLGSTTFYITYHGGDGNDVVVSVPARWDGGGTDDNWMTPANWVGDVAPAEGEALIFPANVPRNLNTNNFPAGTLFAGIQVTGAYQFNGNRINLGAGGIIVTQASQGIFFADVTLAESSNAEAGSIGVATFLGTLDLGPHILTANALGNGVVRLFGPVIGTGEIHKFGDVVARLDVQSSAEVSRPIKVFSGDILFSDTQIDAPIFLDAAGTALADDIEMTGTGTIGPLTVGGASISAGLINGGTGVLTVNGNLDFTATRAVPGKLVVTLAGATANNQDKIVVNGAVKFQGTLLRIDFQKGFAPLVGSSFLIVANDGTDAVQGTLQLAEGGTFAVGGTTFSITYQGGDGNDVVLTVIAAGPAPSPTPKLLNISTRLRVQAGENVLIGGMIATGTNAKKVIVRAIGPTLTDFGLPGALPDPTLEIFQGNVLVASNDDWRSSNQATEIENSGFAPGKDAEAAVITFLSPNQNYTAIVRGKNGETGIGVVEAFDLDELTDAKLGNISTRGFVDVDDNVMIAGVIVGPSGAPDARVLVRALGPTLGDFGVGSFLANPTLELVTSNGTVLRSNDNWKTSQQAEIEAAQLAPSHDEEAALVQQLPPGAYTALVRGDNRTTGVGLVEVYNIQ